MYNIEISSLKVSPSSGWIQERQLKLLVWSNDEYLRVNTH